MNLLPEYLLLLVYVPVKTGLRRRAAVSMPTAIRLRYIEYYFTFSCPCPVSLPYLIYIMNKI